jgi:hypothetical protein
MFDSVVFEIASSNSSDGWLHHLELATHILLRSNGEIELRTTIP